MSKPIATVAAEMEAAGNGAFVVRGKTVEFRTPDQRLFASWSAASPVAAAEQVRLFRASPKHFAGV